MPIYEYECQDCGLRFEKMKSMSRSDEPEACPDCKVPDAKKLVSVVNHTFAHTVVGGPRPQNTGVHSIDYNIDRTIGRDAEQRWKTIGERDKRKDEVIRDARKAGLGVTRDQLVRTEGNDYRVITEAERQTANEGRAKHNQVLKKVAEATKVSGPKKP
jgi:putative FmdB family regulatory protein